MIQVTGPATALEYRVLLDGTTDYTNLMAAMEGMGQSYTSGTISYTPPTTVGTPSADGSVANQPAGTGETNGSASPTATTAVNESDLTDGALAMKVYWEQNPNATISDFVSWVNSNAMAGVPNELTVSDIESTVSSLLNEQFSFSAITNTPQPPTAPEAAPPAQSDPNKPFLIPGKESALIITGHWKRTREWDGQPANAAGEYTYTVKLHMELHKRGEVVNRWKDPVEYANAVATVASLTLEVARAQAAIIPLRDTLDNIENAMYACAALTLLGPQMAVAAGLNMINLTYLQSQYKVALENAIVYHAYIGTRLTAFQQVVKFGHGLTERSEVIPTFEKYPLRFKIVDTKTFPSDSNPDGSPVDQFVICTEPKNGLFMNWREDTPSDFPTEDVFNFFVQLKVLYNL